MFSQSRDRLAELRHNSDMLFCVTVAICVTLALADYRPLQIQNTKLCHCTNRASSTPFSKQHCLPVYHIKWCFGLCKKKKGILKWHLRRAELWERGQVAVQKRFGAWHKFLDLMFSSCGLLCWDKGERQNCFLCLALSASFQHLPVLQRWLCTVWALWCCVCSLS